MPPGKGAEQRQLVPPGRGEGAFHLADLVRMEAVRVANRLGRFPALWVH